MVVPQKGSTMKIIADQNIPFATESFRSFGEVILAAGTEITPELVRDADILLVRSVTKVNEQLLAGSSIKFVGTATIGRDHIDEEYLQRAGIGFSSAPGSNANSVAEWVITAMFLTAHEQNQTLTGKKLAIIGVGNIGSLLREKAEALGMRVVLNDPPKEVAGLSGYSDLTTTLADADFVSFHVPLTKTGPWQTERMINDSLLSLIPSGAVVINAARGKTMVESDLLFHVDRFAELILDVWPEEPTVNDTLLAKVRLGSPHIAGYSWEGKCSGTGMIYRAAAEFFDKPLEWDESSIFKDISTEPIQWNPQTGVSGVLLQSCDLLGDDQRFRTISNESDEKRITYFNRLRKEYPRRYEFRHHSVRGSIDSENRAILQTLGFNVL